MENDIYEEADLSGVSPELYYSLCREVLYNIDEGFWDRGSLK